MNYADGTCKIIIAIFIDLNIGNSHGYHTAHFLSGFIGLP